MSARVIGGRRRERVPTIMALETAECGAASLAMVFAHHSRWLSLEEARSACQVSRDGATARQIMVAARGFGMTAKAYRREPAQVRAMAFPVIAHWRFSHFVVVEGYFDGGWYLNDPARGPVRVDDAEFDRGFTGVVIELVPGPEFKTSGRPVSTPRRVFTALGRPSAALAMAAFIAILLIVPTLLEPRLLAVFGNTIGGGQATVVVGVLVGLVVALLIQAALLLLQGLLAIRFATAVSVRLGLTMVDRLLRLPASYHAARGSASVAQRAAIAETFGDSVITVVTQVGAAVVTMTLAAVVLVVIDPLAGLVTLAAAVLFGVVISRHQRQVNDDAAAVMVAQMERGTVLVSALSQIEAIKASGADDGIIERGISAQSRALVAQQRVDARTIGIGVVPSVITGATVIVVAGVVTAQVMAGSLAQGDFIAVMALVGMLIAPVSSITLALGAAATLPAALSQIDDVMQVPVDDEWANADGRVAPAYVRGEVTLRDVTFGYPGKADVLHGISLHAEPGQRIALVGPSGCGKSTISRLVSGLYRPRGGEVLLDGLPRAEHAPEVLTAYIALVDQDAAVFAGTIRDNITLWDASIPERDIVDAVRDAWLEDAVAARPGGLDAVLAEGGADLSGGQRQRLEIARALVRNPSVLVLDEATSALDPLTELRIDEAVRRRGTTCIVIAHRLSTVRDADEILVLDAGVVVERGDHATLMAKDGAYARLVTAE